MGLFSSVEAKLEAKMAQKAALQREVELSIGSLPRTFADQWNGADV